MLFYPLFRLTKIQDVWSNQHSQAHWERGHVLPHNPPEHKEPRCRLTLFFHISSPVPLLTTLQVNWEVVAEKSGYNSVNTAKVRFGQIKRAIGAETVSTAKPRAKDSTPKTPKKSAGSTKNTPSKIKKSTPPKTPISSAKVAQFMAEQQQEDDDEDLQSSPKKEESEEDEELETFVKDDGIEYQEFYETTEGNETYHY